MYDLAVSPIVSVPHLLSRAQCGDVLGRCGDAAVVREEWVISMLFTRARGYLPPSLAIDGRTRRLAGLRTPLRIAREPIVDPEALCALIVYLDARDGSFPAPCTGDAIWFARGARLDGAIARGAGRLLCADVLYTP